MKKCWVNQQKDLRPHHPAVPAAPMPAVPWAESTCPPQEPPKAQLEPWDYDVKAGAEKGGKAKDALYAVAQQVHSILGGDYKYFSGFNDKRSGDSKHNSGEAFDIVLNDPSGYQSALSKIQKVPGISFAQFERAGQKNSNGSVATADHIHAQISAANGAILSGPMSGYQPNLTMHGTEAMWCRSTQPLHSKRLPAGRNGSQGSCQAQLDTPG
jgi:hypothetical protein